MSAADAVARVPRGKHIFIGSDAVIPAKLVEKLVAQAAQFADNTIVHIMTLRPAPYVRPEYADRFRQLGGPECEFTRIRTYRTRQESRL